MTQNQKQKPAPIQAAELQQNAELYIDDYTILTFHRQLTQLGDYSRDNIQQLATEVFGEPENRRELYDRYIQYLADGEVPKKAFQKAREDVRGRARNYRETSPSIEPVYPWRSSGHDKLNQDSDDDDEDEGGDEDESEGIDEEAERRKEIEQISDELFVLQNETIDDGDRVRATVSDIWQREDRKYVVEAWWGIEDDPYTITDTFEREMGWNPKTCEFDRLMEGIGVEPGNLEEAVEMGMDVEVDITGEDPEFHIPPLDDNETVDDQGEDDSSSSPVSILGSTRVMVLLVPLVVIGKAVDRVNPLTERGTQQLLTLLAFLCYAYLFYSPF